MRWSKMMAPVLVGSALLLGTAVAAAAPAYYVAADVVRGSKNATGPSCVQTNLFKLGEQVVWRVDVYDAKTGQLLDKDDVQRLGVKVVAEVDGVGNFPLQFGAHPKEPPQVNFWAGAWDIPALFKTGVFKWRIVVTDKSGNQGVYDPVGARRPEMPGSWLVVEKR